MSECPVVASHITSVDLHDLQTNVHDASQAQCDSELDFAMNESLTDVDVNNLVVELSSPPPLHRAEVRGESRHSDVLVNDAGICVGLVETSGPIDSLVAPSQDTGAGRAKRKASSIEPTLNYERDIGIMDGVELAKRRRLAGKEAVGASAGVDAMDIGNISDGMCVNSRTARP